MNVKKEKNHINRYFNNRMLWRMIIPVVLEQFFVMLVGIADTFMVSHVGEAAVSGVSLVNSFNTIFIYLFSAFSAGGAVIISQYIGSRDTKRAIQSAGQLLMFSTVFSVIISLLTLLGNRLILRLLFGEVDVEVMNACIEYLLISALSFPALAIYNAGAALCRSIGKTSITMYISTIANMVNIVGNLIGVFLLHAGVSGVAYPTLIARILAAILMTGYCFLSKNEVHFRLSSIFSWRQNILRRVLHVAVPNGIENGVHQLTKVALSSMIAMFGTYQIAANGVAQSIWAFAALMALSMAPIFTTVIGQCMGARDIKAAEYYFKKLTKWTFILSVSWNAFVFILTPLVLQFFSLGTETKELVILLVLINNIGTGIVFPFAGPFGTGLKAAGDVKFTMIITVVFTVMLRLVSSVFFGVWLKMGVIGIAIGMEIDLIFRGAVFLWRYRQRKWTKFKLI